MEAGSRDIFTLTQALVCSRGNGPGFVTRRTLCSNIIEHLETVMTALKQAQGPCESGAGCGTEKRRFVEWGGAWGGGRGSERRI